MVYNAMKLFMEVNPQLFDDCSHEYTESQNNADARKRERQAKWDRLANLAKSKQNGAALPKTITHTSRGIQGPPKPMSPNGLDDTDPLSTYGVNSAVVGGGGVGSGLENLRLADDLPPGEAVGAGPAASQRPAIAATANAVR